MWLQKTSLTEYTNCIQTVLIIILFQFVEKIMSSLKYIVIASKYWTIWIWKYNGGGKCVYRTMAIVLLDKMYSL